MFVLLLAACGEPLLTQKVSAELGTRLCAIGHPGAICGAGQRVDGSRGGCSNRDRDNRWIDIAVPYERKGASHELTVRVRLKSLQPCRVAVDVLEDDGPNPVLLDNAITSALVGEVLCDQVRLRPSSRR